jgi:hypothetical protein
MREIFSNTIMKGLLLMVRREGTYRNTCAYKKSLDWRKDLGEPGEVEGKRSE